MSTEYEYPDGGIEDQIDVDESVWDRGYSREVDEGTWYEVFVNKEIHKKYPTINLTYYSFPGIVMDSYSSLRLDDYEDYGQITFFVPNEENNYTLSELTDVLS